MKHTVICFIILILISSCCFIGNRRDDFSESTVYETISFLNDSIRLFDNISEFCVNEKIVNDEISLVIKSVSKSDFLDFLKRNNNNAKFFNREFKINEYTDEGKSYRKGDSLIIRNGLNRNYVLKDEDNIPHKRKFFLENVIGDYFIFKEIWFEDFNSYIHDAKLNKQILGCPTLTLFSNAKDSIIIMGCSYRFFPANKEPLQILKINQFSVDTLMTVDTDWVPSFVIFDNQEPVFYFIYTYVHDYESKSTFARGDYVLCNDK